MRLIEIVDAREHNLKGLSLALPRDKLIAMTGPSGSGKSSLAIDTIVAEAQLRSARLLALVKGESAVERERPKVGAITGLPPVVHIPHLSNVRSRHTIASFLGIDRELFTEVMTRGARRCSLCHGPMERLSTGDIVSAVLARYAEALVALTAPLLCSKDSLHTETVQFLSTQVNRGFTRFIIDGREVRSDEGPAISWERWITPTTRRVEVVLDRLRITSGVEARLQEAIASAQLLPRQALGCHRLPLQGAMAGAVFSSDGFCPSCQHIGEAYTPATFDFRCQDGATAPRGPEHLCEAERTALFLSTIGSHSLGQILQAELAELLPPGGAPVAWLGSQAAQAQRALALTRTLHLGHLHLLRPIAALSPGEYQRLVLAAYLSRPLIDTLVVLDEPCRGLHAEERLPLRQLLRQLAQQRTTVLVVEHDEDLCHAADHLVCLGPGAGERGGSIVFAGPPPTRRTPPWKSAAASMNKRHSASMQLVRGSAHNVQELSLSIPLHCLCGIAGVSGSGKSSLVFRLLQPLILDALGKNPDTDKPQGTVTLPTSVTHCVSVRQLPQTLTNPTSMVASFVGLFDELRKLFSQSLQARLAGLSPADFALGSAKGRRCPTCKGTGKGEAELFQVTCPTCQGARYLPEIQQIRYRGVSLPELLRTSVADSSALLEVIPGCKRPLALLCKVGLDYLQLGQPVSSLSHGELQRLTLIRDLLQERRGAIYLFDEPTSGLNPEDTQKLLILFSEIIAGGNSIIAIEHNLAFLRECDHLIELGPGAGRHGGKIIASGTPEELAHFPTPTARALKARFPLGAPKNH